MHLVIDQHFEIPTRMIYVTQHNNDVIIDEPLPSRKGK